MIKISGFFMLILSMGCTNNQSQSKSFASTKVTVHLENAYNQKLLLEKLGSFDQPQKKLDSFNIKERLELHVFEVNDSVENLFQVRIANSALKIVFINDVPEIDIYLDFLNPNQFRIEKSLASRTLHEFINRMSTAAKQDLNNSPLTGKYAGGTKPQQEDYRRFVDTVSSPAAALYIFNAIDYGNDHKALKDFVNKLHGRFQDHPGVKRLKNEIDEYVSIFEIELKANDLAPDLSLSDSTGKVISLSSFKGKYVLLDFWAAWNANTNNLNAEKLKVWNQYRSRNFTMVSVSLDPDLEYWKKAIKANNYQWVQLNDPNVWTGKSIKAYKFDSIPFNYLINPDGKVIATAIYGDSLRKKLSEIFP